MREFQSSGYCDKNKVRGWSDGLGREGGIVDRVVEEHF